MALKESAIGFLKMAAEGRVRDAYEKFVAPDFIHHNQYFKGDRQSLMHGMESASQKNPGKRIAIKKAVEEGNTVVTLSHVKQSPDDPGAAVAHIFRFENGLVAELWDLGQPVAPDSPNKNGMF